MTCGDVRYINHAFDIPSMQTPIPMLQMPAAPQPVPLDELPLGVCAIVHHVEADNDDMRRLMTLGICAGRRIELIQRGDPMILRVFNSRLGVSRRLARRVLVQPCDHIVCGRAT